MHCLLKSLYSKNTKSARRITSIMLRRSSTSTNATPVALNRSIQCILTAVGASFAVILTLHCILIEAGFR